jgi:hypothetical protein
MLATLASHHIHFYILYIQVEAIHVIHQFLLMSVHILSECVTFLTSQSKSCLERLCSSVTHISKERNS